MSNTSFIVVCSNTAYPPWSWIIPFGPPVVPEVYRTYRGWSLSSRSGSTPDVGGTAESRSCSQTSLPSRIFTSRPTRLTTTMFWIIPEEGNLVLPRAPHVPVKAEVRDVGLRAREPPRYVRMLSILEDGPPRLEPLQLPRGIRPELPEVLDSASKVSLVIFDCRRSPAPIRELDPLFEGQRLTDEDDLFHLPIRRRLPI